MEEKKMKSNGADSRSSTLKRQRLLSVAAVLLICCLVFVGAAGAVECAGGDTCNHNASVGSKHYDTIGEAISNWGNNQVLTLLADVTLSDVVQLNSTDNHTLNLGTYTMTAAAGKNAIEITSNGFDNRAERAALTINADATNQGGINANNKAVIYYKYNSTLANDKYDRPIIYIKGGVFDGSSSGGISSSGHSKEQDKCATFNISGGIFNCGISLTKAKLLISGGTFNGSLSCTGGSTSYRLISGGTFKSFGLFMTADAPSKFGVGSTYGSDANPDKGIEKVYGIKDSYYDVGVYVNDAGYLVVGGPVITSNDDNKFVAKTANYGGWSSCLRYSSAAENGLYYTSVKEIFADNNKASDNVMLFVDDFDMTDISYKGSITLTGGQTLTLKYPEGTTPAWKVLRSDGKTGHPGSKSVSGGVVTHTFADSVYTITFDTVGGNDVPPIEGNYDAAVTAPADPTKIGYTFAGWDKTIPTTMPAEDLTINASWTANTYTVKFDENGGEGTMNDQPFTYDDVEQPLTALNFTKIGHTFNGWNTAADGSGTEYTDAQLVKNLTTENKGVVPLYAQWTANTYTVTFYANGGEGTMADQSFTYDEESKALTPNAFTRDGYTFNGWNTVSSGSGIAYSDKQNVRNLTAVNGGTVTLYAQWKENPQTPVVTPDDNKPNRVPTTTTPKTTYKVTFYPNGGSGEMNAVTFVEGEQKAIPVNIFTREGYTFKGWALTPGGEVFYTDGESVLIDGATSLYAVWEEVSLEKPEEPTDDPSDKPTEPATPAPILTVLAGLGAAVLSRRK